MKVYIITNTVTAFLKELHIVEVLIKHQNHGNDSNSVKFLTFSCDCDNICFDVSVFTSIVFSGFSSLCAHTLNAPDACGLTFCCLSSNISMTIFFSPTRFNFFKDVLEGWVLVDPPPAPPPPPPRLPMLPMPRRGEEAAGESVVHRH